MAKPTEQQVRTLEIEHKRQFINLVLANRLWLGVFAKIKKEGHGKNSPQWNSWLALGNTIAKLAKSWILRQGRLEKGGATKFNLTVFGMFLRPEHQKSLETIAGTLLPNDDAGKQGLKGVGFIPLLIWAVIAIVGFFTAEAIVDETTTTAEEKSELMKQTNVTLKDLNVTGADAAAIINSTQAQASASGGMFSGMMPIALLAFAAYFLLNSNKSKNG